MKSPPGCGANVVEPHALDEVVFAHVHIYISAAIVIGVGPTPMIVYATNCVTFQ
jgi:hypothetical protein